MRTIRLFCAAILLAVALHQSVFAFALFGPDAPWMTASNGFGDQIGGPMNIGQGYRWNVPVITYAYDQSFQTYFGANGIAEVEKAIQILNDLPPASTLNLANYPADESQDMLLVQSVLDLKSMTLSLLLQEMGVAPPSRYVFCLHDFSISGGTTNYNVLVRNFDPATLAPSTNINNSPFSYSIFPVPGGFGVSPQVVGTSEKYSVADDSQLVFGGFAFQDLTADDAGGLRYLLGTNNIALENLLPGVQGTGTNASNYVTTALRPGVDKITFQRPPFYNSLTGTFFSPFTNTYVDSYISNGVIYHQNLQRVVTRPDILFSSSAFQGYVKSTGASNWVKNASPGSDGPGVIQPPISIAFSRLSASIINSGDYAPAQVFRTAVWGSFDSSTPPGDAAIYPAISPGIDFTTFKLQLSTNYTLDDSTPQFSWTLPGPLGNVYLIQTSTNLSNWSTITSVVNAGRSLTYVDVIRTNTPRRYFRTIAQ